MNYKESYIVLDLLDKYTDANQVVKSFDQTEERIEDVINGLKSNPIDDLDLSVLEALDPSQLKECIKIVSAAASQVSVLKKEAKNTVDILKKSIAEKVLNLCKEEGNTTLEMKFDGYGTVKVIENEVFTFSVPTTDKLAEIVDALWELGFTEFLKVDEKQYLTFAEQFKKDNEQYLPGVESHKELTVKIVGRKTK